MTPASWPSVRFNIQQGTGIPPSTQLHGQVYFAIATRRFSPGQRLPSTRQLANQTNLHRNTISKVYRQLEHDGVVEVVAGSGIYVREPGDVHQIRSTGDGRSKETVNPRQEARRCIDDLLPSCSTLQDARTLLADEINWRLRCGRRVLVSTPKDDLGAAELMAAELKAGITVPIGIVPLEQLETALQAECRVTVVTNRYFLKPVEAVARGHDARFIAVDLNPLAAEWQLLKDLRNGSSVGLVSISSGALRAAKVLLHALRGEELLVMTTAPHASSRLLNLCRVVGNIFCDKPSLPLVERTLRQHHGQLLRLPQLHCVQHCLAANTVAVLRKEIGFSAVAQQDDATVVLPSCQDGT